MFASCKSENSGVCTFEVRQVTGLSPPELCGQIPCHSAQQDRGDSTFASFHRKGAFQWVALKSLTGLSQAAKFNIL